MARGLCSSCRPNLVLMYRLLAARHRAYTIATNEVKPTERMNGLFARRSGSHLARDEV